MTQEELKRLHVVHKALDKAITQAEAAGINIIEKLRGHTSGYAVPIYVIDGPGGGGKIPVGPNYILSQAKGKYVLRNYKGKIYTYLE